MAGTGEANPRSGGAGPISIRLFRVAIPLIQIHGASHGTESLREVVLIEWTAESGVVGWGECSTLSGSGYATETTDEAWHSLVEVLGPDALTTRQAGSAQSLDHTGAAAALRDARLDAGLCEQGVSLAAHLGGTYESMPRCAVIAAVGESPQVIARRAAMAVESGAEMVKIKIAPGHDREVLSAVVDAVHPVQISADANGAYLELEDLEWLDELSLAFVEQPFSAAHTPAQLGERAAGLNTPVALDESIGSLEDMVRLAEVGAASLVSIKPLRLGGIESSVEIGRAARAAGLEVFVGGMLETGIGRAGALAVASALRGPFPTDLGPSGSYFDVDICEPIETDAAGRISAPQGVGLGRTPSPDLLERFTTEEIHLRR